MSQSITCLLIDDDADEPDIFRSALNKLDKPATCVSVAGGVEALLMLTKKESPPDIIFLDMNMSPMNGKQCLKEIKKLNKIKNIPVIIYSTAPVVSQKKEMLEIGAAGFIKKTSSLNDLANLLKECFNSEKI